MFHQFNTITLRIVFDCLTFQEGSKMVPRENMRDERILQPSRLSNSINPSHEVLLIIGYVPFSRTVKKDVTLRISAQLRPYHHLVQIRSYLMSISTYVYSDLYRRPYNRIRVISKGCNSSIISVG